MSGPSSGCIGIGDAHEALHRTARSFLARRCPPEVVRSTLDGSTESLPPFWSELAALGWLGLHVPAEHGGSGYGVAELAVVLEELGRACAPGPFLPTALAAAALERWGSAAQRADHLPSLVAGSPAAVAFGCAPGVVEGDRLTGAWAAVPCAGLASVLLLPATVQAPGPPEGASLPDRSAAGGADGVVWCLVDRSAVTVTPRPSVDETRRLADVSADGAPVPPTDRFVTDPAAMSALAARLLAVEAVGGASWCVDTAASWARVREQFGRPIGQFQAVKHRCADMLCAVELARAAAWDAASNDDPIATAAAAALAPGTSVAAAEACIQVLGGIGFTWEHDAHLYLKRALAVRALVGGAHAWRARVVEHARAGIRRTPSIALPAGADGYRAEIRQFLEDLRARPRSEWRGALAASGYLVPHWPPPWGRAATAVEQLVVDEELAAAHVRRPHLQVGGWVLPTLIAHGTDDQQRRWIPATLRGELSWCQLFSEPGAGSDLASLATKASRVEGGFVLSGQKVWTSMAAAADLGLCLARTDAGVAKHEGITCFVVDMTAEGIDIRPLRELTGHALFNEVFLADVFVPDDCVVGPVGGGWSAARTTLANERVSMAGGSSFGLGEEALLQLLTPGEGDLDPVAADEVGALLVEAQALSVLGLRLTLRAVHGSQPGPEASVRKLLAAEHDQRVQAAGLALLGRDGAANDGSAARWVLGYLANRCLTIAGGTSEIQRNVIAERLLGLPRDP